MAKRTSGASAGNTRKSHKTRKVEEGVASAPPPIEASPTQALAALSSLPQALGDLVKAEASSKKDADSTAIPTEDTSDKQWWYRPPTSNARGIVEKIVVMREAGRGDAEIAKKLKTTEGSVRQYMYLGRKNGWLNTEDEPVDLELEMALNTDRKVVRNVNASLDGRMTNWQTHEMTIAAAKGRGIFKNHETGKSDGGGLPMAVAIQIVMPPVGASDQLPGVDESQMGGTPAYIEGEVSDGGTILPDSPQPDAQRGLPLVRVGVATDCDVPAKGFTGPEGSVEPD